MPFRSLECAQCRAIRGTHEAMDAHRVAAHHGYGWSTPSMKEPNDIGMELEQPRDSQMGESE